MAKLLIEETQPTELEYITEEQGGKKFHYITGPYMRAEVVNGNRRKYPLEILDKEVNRYNNIYVKENRAFGELNHPDSPRINLDRVSHLITELKRDGNDFIGKARIMDTPCGLTVQKILEAGGKLGISSRGLGSLKEQNGVNVVQNDFQLATAGDIVFDPSAPGAFLDSLVEEKTWMFEGGVWKEEDLIAAKKSLMEANKAELEDRALEIFKSLIVKL